MPRKPRELLDGGIYHVFNRGNDRRQLFGEEADYRCFLNYLSTACQLYRAEIYHYCLMPNRYHLLLRISKGSDLAVLMHRLQLAYARYFKKTRGYVGHVFQERYRSPRIVEESYYLQCGRYIERNPVRAELVKEAWEHPYSSARFYVLGDRDSLVTTNLYYNELGQTEAERRQRYNEFLRLEEPYTAVLDEALKKV
jgi:putative transposase